MTARQMPAFTPAVLAGWFFIVAVSVVHGRAPQQGQPQVQKLVKQLSEADFDQRESAERQLIEIGSPAVDSLLKELVDCKPDVCSRIKRILQECSKECDEESLFKVLGVLRLRFEVPVQRIEPMLQRWAFQRRAEVVAAWREQGAVVDDPFEGQRGVLEALANRGEFRGPVPQNKILTVVDPSEVVQQPFGAPTRSNAELIRLVLAGTLEQNKLLVLNSKLGAEGFAKKMTMVQQQPVTVTIGEDWKGDYSVFDFDKVTSVLPIRSVVLKKLEINDSLLSVLKKHPLEIAGLAECSVAAGLKETLPRSVSILEIIGSNASADMLTVVSKQSPVLTRVRFEKSKFGEDEALMLKHFHQLTSVELARMDLEGGAFDGLAEVTQLRRLNLHRCKFPTSAFIDFRQKRSGNTGSLASSKVDIVFKPKVFLGVSGDDGGLGGRFPKLQAQKACIITRVVPGEGAERAGMKIGDEVIQIGDHPIKNFDELRVVIGQYEIGEEATIKVLRDGKELTLKATLGTPNE